MIHIKDLFKAYGKNEVLKGINLDFERPGAITAILGPNGSGKTTLIKSILGMVLPDRGDILIRGASVLKKWDYRTQIDYLPQTARFPENLAVSELLRMMKDLRNKSANDLHLIQLFQLSPFLDQRISSLSGGTRQKVNLTLALMFDSPLLIMDEPTSGLDPVALIRLKDLIREERQKGKTILITTHLMDFVEEMADEIVFLLEGRIHFRGTLQQIKQQYGETSLERAIAKILLGSRTLSMNGNTHPFHAIPATLKS